jgi:hypothetical protein
VAPETAKKQFPYELVKLEDTLSYYESIKREVKRSPIQE